MKKDSTPDLFLEHINPAFREYAQNGTLLESILALAKQEYPNRVITFDDLGFKLEYEGYSNVFRYIEDALSMFSFCIGYGKKTTITLLLVRHPETRRMWRIFHADGSSEWLYRYGF
jgi:hypothetical protein